MIGKVAKYLSDVRHETAKVVWPSRKQLQGSAVVIIIMSLALAAFIFFIDMLLSQVLRFIT